MENNFENIIPAQRIDCYKIGDSYQNLLQTLKNDFTINETNSYTVLSFSFYKFWISKNDKKIAQIAVYKGFKWSFKGINIGSTLWDIKNQFGSWGETIDTYVIPQYKGICFELEDNDIDEEWKQENAPIEAIFVYDPQKINSEMELIYDSINNKYIDKALLIR